MTVSGRVKSRLTSPMRETIKHRPACIKLCWQLRFPCDVKYTCKPEGVFAEVGYVSKLHRKTDDIHDQIRNIKNTSDRMKDQHDVSPV